MLFDKGGVGGKFVLKLDANFFGIWFSPCTPKKKIVWEEGEKKFYGIIAFLTSMKFTFIK